MTQNRLKYTAVLGAIALGLIPDARAAMDSTGLQTAVAVDLVGRALDTTPDPHNRLDMREAEAVFYAPIDQLFDGNLTMAAHQEDGAVQFEVHEAYFGSTRLIPRSRFRVGQFFLGFGRLNQFHRHDWPFTSAPKVQQEFFGDEGLNDTGAEYSYLTPLPFYLELTAGVSNGWKWGEQPGVGQAPKAPTHYLRAVTYYGLPGDGGMQTGLNYVGREDANGVSSAYYGLDGTAKWRHSKVLQFLFQTEVWYRGVSTPGVSDTDKAVGAYVYPQYGFDENLSLGLRGDYYTQPSLKDAAGNALSNSTVALVPVFAYKASEFSTIRASFTQEWDHLAGTDGSTNTVLELQAVLIMGAHPAHDF